MAQTQAGGSRGGSGGVRTMVGYGGENEDRDNYRPPRSLGDMRPYDPLQQSFPMRNINNPMGGGGSTADSRAALYGMPNMGGERKRRRNEMPTADEWYDFNSGY